MERDEKLNVWIRGSKTNPKGIIKALTNVGGINTSTIGKYDKCIYFINYNKIIGSYNISSLEAHCIMNTFKEIQPVVELKDKQLIWCWDDEESQRIVRFYDALNDCTFSPYGCRAASRYEYYEPFEGEYPDWAKEALKMLED